MNEVTFQLGWDLTRQLIQTTGALARNMLLHSFNHDCGDPDRNGPERSVGPCNMWNLISNAPPAPQGRQGLASPVLSGVCLAHRTAIGKYNEIAFSDFPGLERDLINFVLFGAAVVLEGGTLYELFKPCFKKNKNKKKQQFAAGLKTMKGVIWY